jgi:hypothetical protein
MARNNQIIAERQAEDRRAQGEQEEKNYRSKLELIKGRQRSGFGGSGVVVDSDTPFEMLGETAYLGEIDAMMIRSNADREAYGFGVQAMNLQGQSGLYESKGESISPWFSGGATALGGVVSAAGIYASSGAGKTGGGKTPSATSTG